MIEPIVREDRFYETLNDRIRRSPFGEDTAVAFWLDGLPTPILFALEDLRGMVLAVDHVEVVHDDGGVDLIARERICRVEVYNALANNRYVEHPLDPEMPAGGDDIDPDHD